MFMISYNFDNDFEYSEQILLKIGLLFQIQDDFLDCFGDPSVTGKIGTDIAEGKCCWPIITALELSDENQSQILKNNYGINNEENINRIKSVYSELKLIDVYHREEEMLCEDIIQDINDLKNKSNLNTKIFHKILSKIYKRQK